MSYELDVPTGLDKTRAIAVLREGGHWWIAYRGLVRSNLTGNVFRLRKNFSGEAMADLPWVLVLSMKGEFVRVSQVLYSKYVYEQSLSNNWSYGRWEHIASLISCMRNVLKEPLHFLAKLQLINRVSLTLVLYFHGIALFL